MWTNEAVLSPSDACGFPLTCYLLAPQLSTEDTLNEATRGEQYFYIEVPNPENVSEYIRLVHMCVVALVRRGLGNAACCCYLCLCLFLDP